MKINKAIKRALHLALILIAALNIALSNEILKIQAISNYPATLQITFDKSVIKPTSGQNESSIWLRFENTSIKQDISIESKIGEIRSFKKNKDVFIAIKTSSRYIISQSVDSNNLIIRFETLNAKDILNNTQTIKVQENSRYDINIWQYIMVIGFMIALVIILYALRGRLNARGLASKKERLDSKIKILKAKPLDSKSKIIIMQYDGCEYILGVSQNNISLIDKIYLSQQKEDKQSQDMDFKNLLLKGK